MQQTKEKLSNEKFLKIFNDYNQKINELFAEIQDNYYNYTAEEIEEKYSYFYKYRKEAFMKIIEYIKNKDLSDVKTESWNSFMWSNPDECIIDLSETNACIDFNLINDYVATKYINLKGCTIKNLDKLDYVLYYDSFDEKTKNQYPNVFLDSSYPEEIRKKYCKHELTLNDYFSLSIEQRKRITDLSNHLTSHDHRFYENIKDENKIIDFINYYEDSNELIELSFVFLPSTEKEDHLFEDILPSFLPIEKDYKAINKLLDSDVSEWKKIIYEEAREYYIKSSSKIEINKIPKSFVESNKDIFLIDVNIPEEIRKKYYERKLSLEDFFKYIDILSPIFDANSLEESYYTKEVIEKNKEEIINCPKSKQKKLIELLKNEDLVREIEISGYRSLDDYLRTHEFDLYCEYNYDDKYDDMSLEEILNESKNDKTGLNPIYQEGIRLFGLDNILKFEKESGLFTRKNKNVKTYYLLKLIDSFKYKEENYKNKPIDIEAAISDIIKSMQKYEEYLIEKTGFSYKSLSKLMNGKCSSIFLDESLLSSINENEKNTIIEKFYSGKLNYEDLRKYPVLKKALLDKDLDFIFRGSMYNFTGKENNRFEKQDINENEIILNLYEKFGENYRNLQYSKLTYQEAEKKLCRVLFEDIVGINPYRKNIKNLPEEFFEYYPSLSIEEADFSNEELDRIFNSNYKIEELMENLDLVKRLKKTSVAMLSDENYYWITDLFLDDEPFKSNLHRLKLMDRFSRLSNCDLQKEFKDYYLSNKDLNKNIDLSNSKLSSSEKEKFKYREFTIKEFYKNPELIEKMGNLNIIDSISYEYNFLRNMYSYEQNQTSANYKRIQAAIEVEKILLNPENDQYVNEIIQHIKENPNITIENLKEIVEVLRRVESTNSVALSSISHSLVKKLLKTNNPVESFNIIEKIFIKNNIPLFGKEFYCIKILYPELDKIFDFTDNSRISPQLKNNSIENEKYFRSSSNNEKRYMIIYNDLLRIAVQSNSIELKQYLDNIEKGNDIFLRMQSQDISFDELSDSEQKEMEVFEKHLETLYEHSLLSRNNKDEFSELDIKQKLEFLKDKIKPTSRYDLKDRIVRMFAYSGGYKSFDEIRNAMRFASENADKRGRNYAKELKTKRFELNEGDFIRCIGDYQALSGSLDAGNFCKEYLSTINETSSSDTTPLDVDWTKIEKNDSIYDSIDYTPTGFGFGNVYIVMKKDNEQLNITRDENGNIKDAKYDPKKLEMFCSKEKSGGWETHWGIRTGLAFTDIDYILYKKKNTIDLQNPYDKDGNVNYLDDYNGEDDLKIIKFEIARHGYYIPVVDFSGKVIYTPEEFDKLREKMQGLSYYGDNTYSFSNNLITEETTRIKNELEESREDTKHKKKLINNILEEVFQKYNLIIKNESDGDLTPGTVEILDTGSTGRTTNEIGDGDFDFLFRIDNNILLNEELFNSFKEDILNKIKEYSPEAISITDNGDYRIKGIKLSNNISVDIDLTFDKKNDKIKYTTEECIKDRLETLKKVDKEKYEYTIANIILAKRVLKENHIYKSKNSRTPEGGLGGVGVENWILQNGGSFIDAARNFLEVARNHSFEEFKQLYTIWDFGKNHLSERKRRYAYDNFIENNMNRVGYEKMIKTLEEYVINYELSQTKQSISVYN